MDKEKDDKYVQLSFDFSEIEGDSEEKDSEEEKGEKQKSSWGLVLTVLFLLTAIPLTMGLLLGTIPFNKPTINYIKSESKQIKSPNKIVNIVEEKGDAVVSITTTSIVKSPVFLFDDYSKEKESMGLGSGFIVSKDGYIITNQHVVNGAKEIMVKISGIEKEIPAKLIGEDKELDLAVIKVNVKGELPTLALGNSKNIRPGEWAIAIGNPYGLDHTVTLGVISAKDRELSIGEANFESLIQTDTPINPGNSGGPLLNENGEVVGVNTAINAEAQGIGFAIPIDTVKNVLTPLIKDGEIVRPWIGIAIQSLNKEISDYLEIPADEGVLVTKVYPQSPAKKAGLQIGDVITSVDKKTLKDASKLTELVKGKKPGNKIKLLVNRLGEMKVIEVKLEKKQSKE